MLTAGAAVEPVAGGGVPPLLPLALELPVSVEGRLIASAGVGFGGGFAAAWDAGADPVCFTATGGAAFFSAPGPTALPLGCTLLPS